MKRDEERKFPAGLRLALCDFYPMKHGLGLSSVKAAVLSLEETPEVRGWKGSFTISFFQL